MSEKTDNSIFKWFLLVIVMTGLSIVFASNEDPKIYTKSESKEKHTQGEALVSSRHFVKEKLKSPSTAEFGESTEYVFQSNDSQFVVKSYVDSQNGFGAMLRTNYSCVMTFKPNDMVGCENLQILEN